MGFVVECGRKVEERIKGVFGVFSLNGRFFGGFI